MSFEVKNLSFAYNTNLKVLDNISFSVPDGSFTCIIGKTGSGKSTLAKLMCGLLKDKTSCISPAPVIGKVSFAFQLPESQLFETSVIKDAMFGPMNQGLSFDQAKQKAEKYLKAMGIDEQLFEADPFELSGGQQRKAAIAGILAMENKVLILDEPGAGLDPVSKDGILDSVKAITKQSNTTVFMITHNMDEVVKYADYVIELDKGKIKNSGTMKQVMSVSSFVPEITRMCYCLGIKENVLTFEQAVKAISSLKDIRL